ASGAGIAAAIDVGFLAVLDSVAARVDQRPVGVTRRQHAEDHKQHKLFHPNSRFLRPLLLVVYEGHSVHAGPLWFDVLVTITDSSASSAEGSAGEPPGDGLPPRYSRCPRPGPHRCAAAWRVTARAPARLLPKAGASRSGNSPPPSGHRMH